MDDVNEDRFELLMILRAKEREIYEEMVQMLQQQRVLGEMMDSGLL